jgi:8-oxo-dGTP pyrophosphatase MutT (NUDIX family)
VLHLIPPPAHRTALRLVHALRKRWWMLRRPDLTGCRVLALDEAGRILLVRHSYGSGRWMLPGGGIKRGEDPLAAGVRELREETACEIAEAWLLESVSEDLQGARHTVHVVAGYTLSEPQPDGREILTAAFFAADALPDPLARHLDGPLLRWHGLASDKS